MAAILVAEISPTGHLVASDSFSPEIMKTIAGQLLLIGRRTYQTHWRGADFPVVVLSSDQDLFLNGQRKSTIVTTSLEHALFQLPRLLDRKEVYIIGGESLISQAYPCSTSRLATRLAWCNTSCSSKVLITRFSMTI